MIECWIALMVERKSHMDILLLITVEMSFFNGLSNVYVSIIRRREEIVKEDFSTFNVEIYNLLGLGS